MILNLQVSAVLGQTGDGLRDDRASSRDSLSLPHVLQSELVLLSGLVGETSPDEALNVLRVQLQNTGGVLDDLLVVVMLSVASSPVGKRGNLGVTLVLLGQDNSSGVPTDSCEVGDEKKGKGNNELVTVFSLFLFFGFS